MFTYVALAHAVPKDIACRHVSMRVLPWIALHEVTMLRGGSTLSSWTPLVETYMHQEDDDEAPVLESPPAQVSSLGSVLLFAACVVDCRRKLLLHGLADARRIVALVNHSTHTPDVHLEGRICSKVPSASRISPLRRARHTFG